MMLYSLTISIQTLTLRENTVLQIHLFALAIDYLKEKALEKI